MVCIRCGGDVVFGLGVRCGVYASMREQDI